MVVAHVLFGDRRFDSVQRHFAESLEFRFWTLGLSDIPVVLVLVRAGGCYPSCRRFDSYRRSCSVPLHRDSGWDGALWFGCSNPDARMKKANWEVNRMVRKLFRKQPRLSPLQVRVLSLPLVRTSDNKTVCQRIASGMWNSRHQSVADTTGEHRAGEVLWKHASLPSWRREFDSLYPYFEMNAAKRPTGPTETNVSHRADRIRRAGRSLPRDVVAAWQTLNLLAQVRILVRQLVNLFHTRKSSGWMRARF